MVLIEYILIVPVRLIILGPVLPLVFSLYSSVGRRKVINSPARSLLTGLIVAAGTSMLIHLPLLLVMTIVSLETYPAYGYLLPELIPPALFSFIVGWFLLVMRPHLVEGLVNSAPMPKQARKWPPPYDFLRRSLAWLLLFASAAMAVLIMDRIYMAAISAPLGGLLVDDMLRDISICTFVGAIGFRLRWRRS